MSRYDVLLTHHSDDAPAAEAVARELRNRGVTVFLPAWHLVPGESWVPAMERAISESWIAVAIVSNHTDGDAQYAYTRPWADAEIPLSPEAAANILTVLQDSRVGM